MFSWSVNCQSGFFMYIWLKSNLAFFAKANCHKLQMCKLSHNFLKNCVKNWVTEDYQESWIAHLLDMSSSLLKPRFLVARKIFKWRFFILWKSWFISVFIMFKITFWEENISTFEVKTDWFSQTCGHSIKKLILSPNRNIS